MPTHKDQNILKNWRGLRRYFPRGISWFVVGVVVTLVAVAIRPVLFGNDDLEPGRLVVLSGQDDSPGGQRQKLIDRWNDLHPSNPAEIRELSSNAAQQHADMVADAQSGEHTVDIYNLDVTWTAEFAAAHYIRPLGDVDTSGFLKKPLDTCRYQGKLWALPFNTDAGLLYYRTDQVESLPDKLPPASGHPDQSGPYAVQLVDEGLTVNALEAIWSTDGGVLDGQNQSTVDSTRTANGLRDLTQNVTALADRLGRPVTDLLPRFDERAGTDAFIAGQVTMMRNWPVAYAQIKAAPQVPGRVDVADSFDVAELPSPSVLGGQDLAVAAGSTRPRAAEALVRFLTSDDSERALFEDGGFAATRASVYDDPSVRAARPYAATLRSAIPHARPRPTTPYYALFSMEFRQIVRATLNQDGQVPSDAARRIDDALRGQLDP